MRVTVGDMMIDCPVIIQVYFLFLRIVKVMLSVRHNTTADAPNRMTRMFVML